MLNPHSFLPSSLSADGDENSVSQYCGKTVVITAADGSTETATVVDCCPSCPGNGDLDMSTGLFQGFNYPLSAGVFPITWHFAGEGGSSGGGKSSSSSSSSSNDDDNSGDNDEQSSSSAQENHPTPTIAVSRSI